MRVRRLLLFILVAVDLTLVCQGHAAGSDHSGVHLALLGEPQAGDVTGAAQELDGPHSYGLPVREAGRNSDPAFLSGVDHFTGLSTLAVALLFVLAASLNTLGLYVPSLVTWRSRSAGSPEPPPPRLACGTL